MDIVLTDTIQRPAKRMTTAVSTATQGTEERGAAVLDAVCNTCGLGNSRETLSLCGQCRRVRYCSRTCQVQDWRQYHRHTCGTTIRISHGIAGHGVFALDAIPRGGVIGLYDGEDILRGSARVGAYDMASPCGKYTRRGYRHPRRQGGVGQVINDGARLRVSQHGRSKHPYVAPGDEQAYTTMSTTRANASFGDADYLVVATHDIPAGQEIYMSYGIDYWITLAVSEMVGPTIVLRVPVIDALPTSPIGPYDHMLVNRTYALWLDCPGWRDGEPVHVAAIGGFGEGATVFLPTVKTSSSVVIRCNPFLADIFFHAIHRLDPAKRTRIFPIRAKWGEHGELLPTDNASAARLRRLALH